MKSIRVIGTRSRPDDARKRRAVAPEPSAISELRVQLHDMGKAAQPFPTDEARKTYWAKAWELAVVHAATRVAGHRKQFYGLRLAAITSVIIVPSPVGLNLSGTGGSAVR